MLFLRLPGYLTNFTPLSGLNTVVCSLDAFLGAGRAAAFPTSCEAAAQPVQLSSLGSTSKQHLRTSSVTDATAFPSKASATQLAARCGGNGRMSRGFAAIAAPDSAVAEIFDRDLKRRHRNRAARLQSQQDPVLEAVAEGLTGRLDDCKRTFPVAAVINGAGENVVRRLADSRAGIRKVLLLDTSADMLARAQRLEAELRRSQPDVVLPEIQYIQADEEHLPLQQHSIDVVICPLGLHWINDLPGALTQCRHALRPDGLFLGALLGGDSLQELRIACALAEQEVEGGVSPRISPLAQVRDAGNLLTRAGLSIPAVDVDDIVVRYSHPARLIAHLRAMGEGNAARRARRTLRRDTAVLTAQKYQEMFGEDDGTVPATFQVIYLTGWSPHSSQQRAARRGSATASFHDLERELKKAVPGGVIRH